MNALQTIQKKLKAPKLQRNDYGGYNFRNQEDILEAVKPLLEETNSTLIINDELVELGGYVFVKATVELSEQKLDENLERFWTATAYAKHADQQKGMNDAQLTGSTSSYARKYALNGLFLIDDARDPDTVKPAPEKKAAKKPPLQANGSVAIDLAAPTRDKPDLTPVSKEWATAREKIKLGTSLEKIKTFFTLSPENEKLLIEP